MRTTELAYVLIRLRRSDEDCLLLRRHVGWGDWSFVGGHVEVDEQSDWQLTAAREADEELPWHLGVDFEVERLSLTKTWGPQPSPKAAGALTEYRAEYFLLKFLRDPHELVRALPPAEFRLVPVAQLQSGPVARPVRLLLDRLLDGEHPLAASWDRELDFR